MANHGLPVGAGYLEMLDGVAMKVRIDTHKELKKYAATVECIGTSLYVLYQASTCHRSCNGGSHLLERLAGRAHNLASAAFNLLRDGLYDEALNLIRSLGELQNLVLLSVFDKTSFSEWLNADAKTRKRKFGPVHIRLLLERVQGGPPLVVSEDWYGELCEKYVHVTTETAPNMHEGERAHVGSAYQEKGLEKALEALSDTAGGLALLVCHYFKFEDILDELEKQFHEAAKD